MSTHRDISAFANLFQDTKVSKGLAASRWAPDAIDGGHKSTTEQLANVQVPTYKASKAKANSLANSRWAVGRIDGQKMASQQMTNVMVPNNKTSKPTTNGLLNSRWAADTAEPLYTHNSKAVKVQQKKDLKPMLKQPSQDSHDHKTPPLINKTNVTTRCIIGPLSEEEKTVKMENPFFDPKKHKGLSSSRWAD